MRLLRLWERVKTFLHTQKMLISWFKVDIDTKNDIGDEFKVNMTPKVNIGTKNDMVWGEGGRGSFLVPTLTLSHEISIFWV